MQKSDSILVVGHQDIIEGSICARLTSEGYSRVFSSSQIGLNPTIQTSVYEFFQENRPQYVFLASTRSGGIQANIERGGEFMYHNLQSQSNFIYAAQKFGTKKLMFFAGSCVYPNKCTQPMTEDMLLTGPLEETSEPYALAKLAGLKLCQAYKRQYGLNAIVAVPATIYGPGSDTDLPTAHVMGALIAKFVDAKKNKENKVTVWGSGTPRREFLFVDDFVDASLFLMERYQEEKHINVGFGNDVSIKELAKLIASVIGFDGDIVFDQTKPDGTKQKLLDSSRINKMGWKPKIDLKTGIRQTVDWYQRVQKETACAS